MIIEEWRHWFVVTGLRATSVLDNFYYVIWYLGDNYRGNGSIAVSRLLHGTLHNLAGNGIDLSMYLWKYFLGKNFFREDYNTVRRLIWKIETIKMNISKKNWKLNKRFFRRAAIRNGRNIEIFVKEIREKSIFKRIFLPRRKRCKLFSKICTTIITSIH